MSTDSRNTFLTTTTLRQGGRGGGTAVLDDGDKDKCVIVVEVTVADRPSVQFEVVRRMDGRTK